MLPTILSCPQLTGTNELLCFRLIFPAEFLYGLVGIICAVMTVVLAISKHHALRQLRGNHPWALLLCLAFLGYMVVTRLRDIAVFAFPFAVSVLGKSVRFLRIALS